MHFFVFFCVASRGCASLTGCVRFTQVTAALPPLLTLCVHYFGRADVTAPKVLVKHSTSRMPFGLLRGRGLLILLVRVRGCRRRGFATLG